MDISMRKFMKVGTILHVAYDGLTNGQGPILECLKKIVTDDYFEVVEVTQIKDPQVRKEAAEMIKCGNMEVAYGGQARLLTVGLNINDLDEERRKAAVATLIEGIDEAYEIGALDFTFLAGQYEEETKEESYKALLKSTRELCQYAKSKGDMPVLIEVFDYDIDKKSLIGPVDMVKRFAKDITKDFDNFGLMIDNSHIPMLHETLEESILPVKEYIKHAHMGNTVIKDPNFEAYGDNHPRFGFPNSENGVEDLAAYLRLLLDIGFLNEKDRPIVSFEVKPWKGEDPEVVIANCKRALNLAWELV